MAVKRKKFHLQVDEETGNRFRKVSLKARTSFNKLFTSMVNDYWSRLTPQQQREIDAVELNWEENLKSVGLGGSSGDGLELPKKPSRRAA